MGSSVASNPVAVMPFVAGGPPKRGALVSAARTEIRTRATSTQLAVLAATPVVSAERVLLAVVRFLAIDAEPHAGHGLAARFGNRRLARFAMRAALPARNAAARALHRVVDGRIDLVLHSAVAGPARCH